MHTDSNRSRDHEQGRVAGVDFGTVRVGLAVSDRSRRIASPLTTYTRRGEDADAAWFRTLVEQEEIVDFVVGLPLHLDGRESQKSGEARSFGRWLELTTGIPVTFFDERFSTREAEQALTQRQTKRSRRRGEVDMLAARVLLEAYLEAGSASRTQPGALDD